jgi:anaphase-promoting complex subunit 4
MAQQLSLFSETEFASRAADGLAVGCPTLDLSAACESGAGKSVFIYRPPGQVVSKIHQHPQPGGKPPEALVVAWKADGKWQAS